MRRLISKYKIIFVALSIIIATLTIYVFRRPEPKVVIRGVVFSVEVAVTGEEKSSGLGNRDKLEDGRGMIFVFDHKDLYPFWMKGMKFPIDILWISGNVIVDITKNAPAPDDPENTQELPIYHPNEPIDRVLELNAGTVEKYGISTGDMVLYKL